MDVPLEINNRALSMPWHRGTFEQREGLPGVRESSVGQSASTNYIRHTMWAPSTNRNKSSRRDWRPSEAALRSAFVVARFCPDRVPRSRCPRQFPKHKLERRGFFKMFAYFSNGKQISSHESSLSDVADLLESPVFAVWRSAWEMSLPAWVSASSARWQTKSELSSATSSIAGSIWFCIVSKGGQAKGQKGWKRERKKSFL